MAVGCIDMSLDDFCRCYVEEFEAICRAWSEMREYESRADWERVRILASIIVSPYVKGDVHPQRLLPMPWDKESDRDTESPETPQLSAEEQLERGRALARQWGYQV